MLGKTLQKVAPWALKSAKWGLKRSPWGGLGMALAPAILNLGEAGYQKFFDDDPDEAGERLRQTGRTALEEALALGTLGLGRGGLNLIRNLSRGLGETIPSVTGARRATGAADEAARAAPPPPPPNLAEEAKTATEAAAAAEDQARAAQDALRANRRATVLKNAAREGGTVGRRGTRRPDFSTKQTHTPGDVEQQGGLPFNQPRGKGASLEQATWGQQAKRYDKVRGIPTSKGIFVDVKGPARTKGAQTIIYRKPMRGGIGKLQFPGIQSITHVNDPGEMVGRLQQILIEDGVDNIDDVIELLRQDRPNTTVLGWVIPRLDSTIANKLSPREWSKLLSEMGKPSTVGKLKDILD